MLHWFSDDDVLMYTTCWSTFAVTCLRRCAGCRLNSTPQTRDHGSTTFSPMQVNPCWLEEKHFLQTAVRTRPPFSAHRRGRRPPPIYSRSTLKSGSSRTQPRHLEHLATSLQTLADNDWRSHRSSDDCEEPGRGVVKSRHQELQERSKRRIRKYLGMALEKQQGASLPEDDAVDFAPVIESPVLQAANDHPSS